MSIPIASRSSSGINFALGPPDLGKTPAIENIESRACRLILFCPNGKYFAFVNGDTLKVLEANTFTEVCSVANTKTCCMAFSPKSTYFAAWERYAVTKQNPEGALNLHIYKTETGELIRSFLHKKQHNWEPQWSADEKIFARMVNNDVVFCENSNYERIVNRLNCHKFASYKLAPNSDSYYVVGHTPGASGQPSFGRLFQYPKFESDQAVANKSFFNADKVDFLWNSKGNSVLLLTSTEVDATGGSYYGKQALYFIGVNGQTLMITLNKEGPIHSVAWSPKNNEFCVVYGFMPSQTTIFNLKCEAVFEFGADARNTIHYSPFGNILLLGGFGNLRGSVQLWDAVNHKQIGSCEAPDTTYLQWSEDGEHFLTATTAPRLRISNGFKIWHYTGALLYEKGVKDREELYDVYWKTFPKGSYKEPMISTKKVEGITSSQPLASKQAYRPPSARNRTIHFSLHDDGDSARKTANEPPPSKASLKQKKKRDAKKAKRIEEGDEKEVNATHFVSNVQINPTGDPETDKKLKNIKKKLDAIEKLKEQQAQGKTLEINQLAKLKGEEDLLKELQQLQL